MLQNNHIAKLLDMEHMILKEVKSFSNQLVLHVEMERRSCECPACRTLVDTVHDYRLQHIKDSPIQGKTVVWLYRKRRYRCPCCGKRFYERNYLIPKWHRITNRLHEHAGGKALAKGHCTQLWGVGFYRRPLAPVG